MQAIRLVIGCWWMIVMVNCAYAQQPVVKERSKSKLFAMVSNNIDKAPIGLQFGSLNKDGFDVYGSLRLSNLQLEHSKFNASLLNVDTLLFAAVDSAETRASFTLGITYPIKKLWLYTGIGVGANVKHYSYVSYNLNDPTSFTSSPEGVWYRDHSNSNTFWGVEYEVGAIINFMGAKVAVGGAAVNFKKWMLTLGAGLTIPDPKKLKEDAKKKLEEKAGEIKKKGQGEIEKKIKGEN